jgi:hypothetical protein
MFYGDGTIAYGSKFVASRSVTGLNYVFTITFPPGVFTKTPVMTVTPLNSVGSFANVEPLNGTGIQQDGSATFNITIFKPVPNWVNPNMLSSVANSFSFIATEAQ